MLVKVIFSSSSSAQWGIAVGDTIVTYPIAFKQVFKGAAICNAATFYASMWNIQATSFHISNRNDRAEMKSEVGESWIMFGTVA